VYTPEMGLPPLTINVVMESKRVSVFGVQCSGKKR
jgi:hypothetical protein